MSNCQKLWSIWFITYLLVINVYLTVVSIKDYLELKYQFLDLAFGGDWDTSTIYVILCCLNVCLGLFPIIIYMSVVHQGNLANDGHVLGRDPDVFHLTVNEYGKGEILPTINKKNNCCQNPVARLLYMELPPLSYFLQVISATCFLIPRSIVEGHRIHHRVFKINHIWHSDLDFIFDPDQQHSDFVIEQNDSYIQPVSVAYFNLGLSLVLLSLQYSRVLWHISRKFTVLLSSVMILWTVHVLVEYCSITMMIKISLNSQIVSDQLKLTLNAFIILVLFISSNLVLLLSFITVFHYGVLQYADMLILRNRKSRRQMVNSSPQMIGSNHLDIPGAFSPSVSENNYSDSSVEPLFSKSHMSHIIAIACLCVSTSLKSTNLYLSFVHFYQTTADLLTLVNLLISGLFAIVWLIIWFALALRRTWNFRIKSDAKFVAEPLFFNGNPVQNNAGTMQLHQLHNSLLRNTKSSDMNFAKQDMMVLNRNVGLDGGSDDTDMSSKMSSNNYVFLQSMRNGQIGLVDATGQQSLMRNPLYLSYNLNNQGLQNNNTVYANDDSINNRSVQLDDQLGSEHSYNSNRSRNMAFENMPPILPNFDENRYKILNPNSAAMEKLIPRYLRNPSSDYNTSVHFSMSNNNNECIVPVVTSPTMSYNYDNSLHNHNIARYKQSFANSQMMRPTNDKYATIPANKSSAGEMQEYSDGDCGPSKTNFDGKRVGKSPVMFPTVEEIVADGLVTESECLLPSYSNNNNNNNNNSSNTVFMTSDHQKVDNEGNMINNNGESDALNDRMCSQV